MTARDENVTIEKGDLGFVFNYTIDSILLSNITTITTGLTTVTSSVMTSSRSLFEIVLIETTLAFLIIITILGNLLVCVTVTTDRKLHSPTNCFIVSLSTTDLLLGVLVLPVSAYATVEHDWPFGAALCNVYVSLDVMFCTVSILTLFAISLDRYFAIVVPLRYHQAMRRSIVFKINIGLWLFSAVVAFVPIHVGLNTPDGTVQNYDDPRVCSFELNAAYTLVIALGTYFVPLAVMCAVYLKILRVSRRQAKAINRLSVTTNGKVGNRAAASGGRLVGGGDGRIGGVIGGEERRGVRGGTDASRMLLVPSAELGGESATLPPSPACTSRARTRNCATCLSSVISSTCLATAAPAQPGQQQKHKQLQQQQQQQQQQPQQVQQQLLQPQGQAQHQTDHQQQQCHEQHQQQQCYPQQELQQQPVKQSELSTQQQRHSQHPVQQLLHVTDSSHPCHPSPQPSATSSFHDLHLLPHGRRVKLKDLKLIVSERKATVTLATVVAAFAVCWIPYFVLFVSKPFLHAAHITVNVHVDLVALWLGYANSSVNPFLYAFYNSAFRDGFRRTLRCRGRNPCFRYFDRRGGVGNESRGGGGGSVRPGSSSLDANCDASSMAGQLPGPLYPSTPVDVRSGTSALAESDRVCSNCARTDTDDIVPVVGEISDGILPHSDTATTNVSDEL